MIAVRKILAIDPSSTCIGYAVFELCGNEVSIIKSGHFYIKAKSTIDKLKIIESCISELGSDYDDIVIEINISAYSRNIKYISLYQLVTGFIIGKFGTEKLRLAPVSEWKSNKSEEQIAMYAKLTYNISTRNRDELTAIWLGHWFINQLIIQQRSLV